MAQSEAEVSRKTDTIMAQADKDGDGVVTFDGEKLVVILILVITLISRRVRRRSTLLKMTGLALLKLEMAS